MKDLNIRNRCADASFSFSAWVFNWSTWHLHQPTNMEKSHELQAVNQDRDVEAQYAPPVSGNALIPLYNF